MFPGPGEHDLGLSFLIGWAARTWTRTYLDLRISKILHVALDSTSSTPRLAATAMAKGESPTTTQFHTVINSARFVEFETAGDLKVAVDKLDNQDFKGASVRCLADVRFPTDSPMHLIPKSMYRPKTRFPATIVTALARLHPFVEAAAAIHHLTATTAVARLRPVAIALVVMITVVAPHPVTITTPVIAATVLHLPHAQLAHPLTIPTHHLHVAATAMILTALRLVVDMKIPMLPTDMIGLGLDRLRGLMADTMSVPRHRDTGEYLLFCSVQEPLIEGSRLL